MRIQFLPVEPGGAGRVLPFMARLYAHDAIDFDAARARSICDWLLAHPEAGGIWIIEADSEPAGYLVITVCVSLEFHGRFALLDELYLDPRWRGRNLGPAAIEFAAGWSRERGFSALRLEVALDNEHGLHVYRKSGFTQHDRHIMTRWLG